MGYAELVASDDYITKHAGAELQVLLVSEADPGKILIGAVTGLTVTVAYEVVGVEEAGNEKTTQQVQGRATVTASLNAFWTPEWGDRLQDTSNFIGEGPYTIIVQIGPNWPNAGTVVDAVTGCIMSNHNKSFGARGARTMDMAFAGIESLRGTSWEAA